MITECPHCNAAYKPDELDHVLCRKCAENHMIRRFGGSLDLPADWYSHDDDEEIVE